jgi:hypothetical protein
VQKSDSIDFVNLVSPGPGDWVWRLYVGKTKWWQGLGENREEFVQRRRNGMKYSSR